MERILFGDNQFFAVNHISDEKSRALMNKQAAGAKPVALFGTTCLCLHWAVGATRRCLSLPTT